MKLRKTSLPAPIIFPFSNVISGTTLKKTIEKKTLFSFLLYFLH